MSWVMSSGVRSAIAKVAAVGALITVPALNVPILAHAAPGSHIPASAGSPQSGAGGGLSPQGVSNFPLDGGEDSDDL